MAVTVRGQEDVIFMFVCGIDCHAQGKQKASQKQSKNRRRFFVLGNHHCEQSKQPLRQQQSGDYFCSMTAMHKVNNTNGNNSQGTGGVCFYVNTANIS